MLHISCKNSGYPQLLDPEVVGLAVNFVGYVLSSKILENYLTLETTVPSLELLIGTCLSEMLSAYLNMISKVIS